MSILRLSSPLPVRIAHIVTFVNPYVIIFPNIFHFLYIGNIYPQTPLCQGPKCNISSIPYMHMYPSAFRLPAACNPIPSGNVCACPDTGLQHLAQIPAACCGGTLRSVSCQFHTYALCSDMEVSKKDCQKVEKRIRGLRPGVSISPTLSGALHVNIEKFCRAVSLQTNWAEKI